MHNNISDKTKHAAHLFNEWNLLNIKKKLQFEKYELKTKKKNMLILQKQHPSLNTGQC